MKTEWLQAGTLFCGVVGAMSALSIQAAPPGPTLAEYVAKAELIVVGKLEPWETHQSLPAKPGAKGPWAFRYATVNIQIREVLKGKAGLKTVPIRFCVGWVDKPEPAIVPGEYQTRADGVWILSRDQGHLAGPCFPVEQQAEIVGLIKQLPAAVEPAREKPVVQPVQRLPDSPAPPLVKVTREEAVRLAQKHIESIGETGRWKIDNVDRDEKKREWVVTLAGQSRTLPPGASGRTYARKVTDAAQVYVSDSGDVRFRDFSDMIR